MVVELTVKTLLLLSYVRGAFCNQTACGFLIYTVGFIRR